MQAAMIPGGSGGGDSDPSRLPRRLQLLPKSVRMMEDEEGKDVGSSRRVGIFSASAEEEADAALATAGELDRLKKDKTKAYSEIERYKKLITYAIIMSLFSLLLAVVMVAWRFTADRPSFEEMRRRVLSTPNEEPRLCVTVYPNAIARKFSGKEVGQPLYLTKYLEEGHAEEAARAAKVEHIMQSERSYSGFLTVNRTTNSNLFFWYFPSVKSLKEREHHEHEGQDEDDLDDLVPLVLWLQGGPGWPTMYGLFKENGPFLCGFEEADNSAFLVPNKFSWTRDHHMLYIDNPVGAGFSFTEDEAGYPRTDEAVALDLVEALRQFMLMFPFMTRGQPANRTAFYAFGESYGGAYVVSLARAHMQLRRKDPGALSDIDLRGIGIGNGFLSAVDQSVYADYVQSLGYITEGEIKRFRELDDLVVSTHDRGDYAGVILHSQESLHYLASQVMNLTNIYDFTFDGNYLTNHEYICFLQQEHVRTGIHVGDREFNRGYDSYTFLNQSVMVSKKPWLDEVLEDGKIEVLVYNGNLDVIVHVLGTSRMVKSLRWKGSGNFTSSERQIFWAWNEDTERGEVAGYFHEGGGLTFVVVRNAGHMVPISQPRWARQLVYEFTHRKPKSSGGRRFEKPAEIKEAKFSAFQDCSL